MTGTPRRWRGRGGTAVGAVALAVACSRHVPPAAGPPTAEEAPVVAEAAVEADVPEAVPAPADRLARFHARLDALDQHAPGVVVTVLHLGASHTAFDTFTGPLRRRFQTRFGDAGRGYEPAGTPWRWFREEGMTYDEHGRWTAWRATRSHATGPFGITAVRQQSDHAGDALVRGTATEGDIGRSFDHVAVHFLAVPGGGHARVRVDGEVVHTVSTALAADETARLRAAAVPTGRPSPTDRKLPTPPEVGRLLVVEADVPDAPHEVRVEVVGDGPVSVLGIDTTRAVSGVRYLNEGVSGSRADQWLQTDPVLVAEEVARLAPDLVVFHWGINEMFADSYWPHDPDATDADWLAAASLQTETYRQMWSRVRAGAPDAECLVLLPTDVTPESHPTWPEGTDPCVDRVVVEDGAEPFCVRAVPRTHATIRAAQVAFADEAGCAVWDQQAFMGGPGGMNQWRAMDPPWGREDGIHLTMEGYEALAAGLFEALVGE